MVSKSDQEVEPVEPDSDGTGIEDLNARRRDLKGARRRQQILELLQTVESRALSVEEIADRFGISFATVRRDLQRLHQDRQITRTYGGVELAGPGELSIHQRHLEFNREKDAIGRRAAGLVGDGQVVIIDAGTTTEFVARHLAAQDVTVFTNGIGAINILLGHEQVSVVVLGGRLRTLNQTITGAEAEQTLRQVMADHAFIGADAVHPQHGVASRTFEQSRLKSLMMQRAKHVTVVADHRKVTADDFHYWSPVPPRWRLITDDKADPVGLDQLRGAAGAQIDLVHPLRALNETDYAKGDAT